MNEKLMAEGYKEMAEENLRLAKQFLEMVYAIKLPKLKDDDVVYGSLVTAKTKKLQCVSNRSWDAVEENIDMLLNAQIDLIKEANKNINWRE